MAKKSKNHPIQSSPDGNALDRALQRFSEILIERMEEQKRDWKKGWIGGGSFVGLPQNITGRTYEGSNAFLLFIHTAMKKYHAPVYATFPQISKEGAHVLKGEKSIPVFKWGLSIKDKDGKRISESEYRLLSNDEQKECDVRPYLKVFSEYNIDQTNLAEVNKAKYDALVAHYKVKEIDNQTEGMYVNAALDRMMEKQEWVCPILYQDEEPQAYYSPSKDIIVLPTKAQFNLHPADPEECFKDGQEFYGTALHEMAHSTGHESRLNRGKSNGFGSPEYAKEELVAELTSAMVGHALGFDRRISDNNVAYLQNWISVLRQEPKFIVSVMSDVNKASRMEIESIDKQRIALSETPLVQGTLDGVEESINNKKQFEAAKNLGQSSKPGIESELLRLLGFPDQKEYYNEISLLQVDERTGESHELYDKVRLSELWLNGENNKIMEILKSTKEDYGASMDGTLLSSFKTSISKDEKIGEDGKYVFHLSSDDDKGFLMYEKVSREDLLYKHLSPHLDEDLLSVEGYSQEQIDDILSKAKELGLAGLSVMESKVESEEPREAVAKEWASLDEKPILEMDSGDKLPIGYNKDKDTLEVAVENSDGKIEIISEEFDHNRSIEENVGHLWERVSNMPHYGAKPTVPEDIAKQYSEKGNNPSFRLNDDTDIYYRYNQETNKIVTSTTPSFTEERHFDYNIGLTWDENMISVRAQLEEISNLTNPKEYFSTLMTTITDGQHDGHTALDIKNMAELRKYFKDNPHIGEWVSAASNKELIEAGADMLPYLRYSHKEGRTLHDIEAAYSNINARYEDVRDERSRQIAHRVRQAEAIVTSYHNNIENAHEKGFLFKEDSAHKMLPREEYALGLSQSVTQTKEQDMDKEEKYYFSYQYLQFADDTDAFDKLQDKQDYKAILQLAEQYDQGDAMEQGKTFKNAKQYPGDDILDEDDNYAVVYNGSVGGTYSLMRKVSKEDILDNIERYGLEKDATDDVKKIANEAASKNIPEHHQIERKDKQQEQSVTPHEDGNPQTDVAGKAKEIAATGIPMEQAEKQAQAIVNNDIHRQYHEKEAKNAEQKKADAEKLSAEKKKSAKQKDGEAINDAVKSLTHTALLVEALDKAREHDGVWMNLGQKGNAEFLNTHTPITAYNNIMMVLNSDANKYKTNLYTYYQAAKQNEMPVMKNQSGMAFHWTNWQYQNAMDKADLIDKKKYDSLPEEEKSFYAKHATRTVQTIYNIDQTTMNGSKHENYMEMVKLKGRHAEEQGKESPSFSLSNYDAVQKKHPDAVIVARNNETYEIYRDYAQALAPVLSLQLQEKKDKGKIVPYISFPYPLLDSMLPKMVKAKYRVAITDTLPSPKMATKISDNKEILNKAYETARVIAAQSGIQYERVMVMQDAKYDSKDDKLVVSGMKAEVGNEHQSTLYKANDIYRSIVAATGSEKRLDRSGRNNLLPEDDAKHEKLVQELAAGVMMVRQGLPAVLSKENVQLIPYWQREIKENPRLMGIIERDVNNAVEVIDSLLAKHKVNYEAIRGQLPQKMLTEHPSSYSIVNDLGKLPSIETKEIVIIKDKASKNADVILPAGASLEVNNEVPGMSKSRIKNALKKEDIKEVRFYNASGSLGLNKPNEYFQGKEVSVNKLKQYELLVHQTLDVSAASTPKKEVDIKIFQAIKDDNGKYAFFIKPENEPSFSVYPTKEHLNTFFNVIKTDSQVAVHKALAKKYYEMATKHPDSKKDLIMPKEVKGVDVKLIERPSITSSAQDSSKKIIFATINGERVHAPISKVQWQKMWLAEDMAAYKRGLAAIIFEPMIKRGMGGESTQQASKESESQEMKDAPSPGKDKKKEIEQAPSRGIHM